MRRLVKEWRRRRTSSVRAGVLWRVCPVNRSAHKYQWAILRNVVPYWGSVWYEKVTEDQYQSGGHCGFVALSLALARSTSRLLLGGGWGELPADLMRSHADFGQQMYSI